MELEAVEVVADGLAFPEGPVAMADGSVIVVEMMGGVVSRIEPDGHRTVVADVGGGPNGAAIGPDGFLYVCNNGGYATSEPIQPCIQRVDISSGVAKTLYTESGGTPLKAPNDIVFDDSGNFWFTDFGGDSIHYAAPDGSSVEAAITGLHSPNGVGLSPDGDVLYWAETYTRQVHRRRLDGPGKVVASPGHDVVSVMEGRRPEPWTLVAGLAGGCQFDSLGIEASGFVCVGTLLDGGITVIDPADGTSEHYGHPLMTEDGVVTNICFGGDEMCTAWVTCSGTGRLLRCEWPRPGLRTLFS